MKTRLDSQFAKLHKRTTVVASVLLVTLIVGIGLRVAGLTYGLPYLYHPDEPLGVWVPLGMLKTGDLNPHFFGYGSLFFYLNALAYVIYFLIGTVFGVFRSPADIPDIQKVALGVGYAPMPTQIIILRLVSVAVGVSCIILGYYLGKRLSNRYVGLLAAASIALSPSLVTHSELITPNILATSTILATLTTLVHLTPKSPRRAYVLVGIAFGAAVASKYNAGLLIVPCVATFLLTHGRSVWRQPGPYLSAVTAVIVFLLITPYAVLDTPKFVEDTLFHLNYYSIAHHPGMEGDTLGYYLHYLLSQEGLLGFIGVAGCLAYLKNRKRNGLILASFAVPYVVYISTLQIRNDRTILIVLPVLLIVAADWIWVVWLRFIQQSMSKWARFAAVSVIGFVILSFMYQGWNSVEVDVRLTTPDAREYARQWMTANIPTTARIAAEAYTPFMDPAQRSVTYFDALMNNAPDWYVAQGFEWLVLSSGTYGRFYARPQDYPSEIAHYDALQSRFPRAMVFDQNGIVIQILHVTH